MPQCVFCDHNNPAGARTCQKCGAELSSTAENEERTSDATIADLLIRGEKIEAIKRYRERTGLGLKEAMEAVEALAHSQTRLGPSTIDPEFEQQLLSVLRGGNKIAAIKLYRERTRVGLKEAKDAVEGVARRHGLPEPKSAGCAGVVLLAVFSGFLLRMLFQ